MSGTSDRWHMQFKIQMTGFDWSCVHHYASAMMMHASAKKMQDSLSCQLLPGQHGHAGSRVHLMHRHPAHAHGTRPGTRPCLHDARETGRRLHAAWGNAAAGPCPGVHRGSPSDARAAHAHALAHAAHAHAHALAHAAHAAGLGMTVHRCCHVVDS